ncbi:MAG TPA: DNA-3-methyladenine glycosylase I [Dongiaceae bacterium]|jgi:3-methyladenine DNA glycosylase Tag|nr:DNA-3-methyladenine glycosylase I [Dongiaceae bacterium]
MKKRRKFAEIAALAGTHHGGPRGIKAKLAESEWAEGGLDRGDDRFLAGMTHAIFSSGFSWTVVEQKWPGFEKAFKGFNPRRVALYSDDDLARLLADKGVIRNGAKLRSTIENARFVVETAKEYGSFGAFLKQWPTTDQVGLMEYFQKHAARLGGQTAMYFLRFNGWDSFILSKDVTRALIREGVIDKPATSKKALRAVQDAFNAWTKESGRPQREVSRILALSVGPA